MAPQSIDRLRVSVFQVLDAQLTGDVEAYVCWSGGKDATALLELAAQWAGTRDRSIGAVHVPYPSCVTGSLQTREVMRYWGKKGIAVTVLPQNDPDPTRSESACMQCKSVRRSRLREFIEAQPADRRIALLTGHTCYDLAAYAIELLLWRLRDDGYEGGSQQHRMREVLNRFLQAYDPNERVRISRPILHLNEQDVDSVLESESDAIPYDLMKIRCPWEESRPKRLFQQFFRHRQSRFDLDLLREQATNLLGEAARLPEHPLPLEDYIV